MIKACRILVEIPKWKRELGEVCVYWKIILN
jgi:hypothetical protein